MSHVTKRMQKRLGKEWRGVVQSSCPLSKEKNDSSELRICTQLGKVCPDGKWKYQTEFLECQVFLENQKNKSK